MLYYNTQNVLCAWSLHENKSIEIGTSELSVLKSRLKSTPDEWFTFYDQQHTTGTDIAQTTDATALLTVGLNTLQRDLTQGAMRMRGLPNDPGQRIECVITEEMAKIKPKKWEIEDIIQFTTDNQLPRLGDDDFKPAPQKMENVIRRNLLDRIMYNKQNSDQKNALYNKVSEVFLTKSKNDVLEQFDKMLIEQPTGPVLDKLCNTMFDRWFALRSLDEASPITEEETKTIKEVLTQIAEAAKPLCFKTVKQTQETGQEVAVQTEKQKGRERKGEKEQEKEQEIETQKPDVKPYTVSPSGHQFCE